MLIDSHAHLVTTDTDRYPPAPMNGNPESVSFENSMEAEELIRQMDKLQIERAMVVQRAHMYGFDNSYVVDSAEKFPDRLSAVCAINGREPDAGKKTRYWIEERGATGIRMSGPNGVAANEWLTSPHALEAWRVAGKLGAAVRIHMYRWNREECLAEILQHIPEFSQTRFVIDHLANLPLDHGEDSPQQEPDLQALAKLENTTMMFSTINLLRMQSEAVDMAQMIKNSVALFGAKRVMWGSDIAQTPLAYNEMTQLAIQATDNLSADEKAQVLHNNADTFFSRLSI